MSLLLQHFFYYCTEMPSLVKFVCNTAVVQHFRYVQVTLHIHVSNIFPLVFSLRKNHGLWYPNLFIFFRIHFLPWVKEFLVLAEKGFGWVGRLVRALPFMTNEGRAALSVGYFRSTFLSQCSETLLCLATNTFFS